MLDRLQHLWMAADASGRVRDELDKIQDSFPLTKESYRKSGPACRGLPGVGKKLDGKCPLRSSDKSLSNRQRAVETKRDYSST